MNSGSESLGFASMIREISKNLVKVLEDFLLPRGSMKTEGELGLLFLGEEYLMSYLGSYSV